jgi:hypothetical protein
MNHEYTDIEAAIRGDTARLRDKDGTFARGMFWGLAFTGVLGVLGYAAWVWL